MLYLYMLQHYSMLNYITLILIKGIQAKIKLHFSCQFSLESVDFATITSVVKPGIIESISRILIHLPMSSILQHQN